MVIVISGGSDGLGKAIAKRLSGKNRVVAISRNEKKLKEVSIELNCDFEVCDISDSDSVKKTIENIIKKYKRIDCLINNAGVWIEGELDTNDYSRIKDVIDINTTGTIFLTKAVISQMKKRKEGRIINIISQAGLYAKAKRSVYNASKFALTGFTKSIQKELSEYGINVIGVYPGKLKTGLFNKVGIKKDFSDAIDADEVAKAIEFALSFPLEVNFPEIGMKHLRG